MTMTHSPADSNSRGHLAMKVDRWWRDQSLNTRLRIAAEIEAGRALAPLAIELLREEQDSD
jgi:hypothetical protein